MQAKEGKTARNRAQTECVEGQDLEEAWLIREMAGGWRGWGTGTQCWKVIGRDVGKRGCCQMGRQVEAFGLDPVGNGIIIR